MQEDPLAAYAARAADDRPDVNERDDSFCTPLHVAILHGQLEAMQVGVGGDGGLYGRLHVTGWGKELHALQSQPGLQSGWPGGSPSAGLAGRLGRVASNGHVGAWRGGLKAASWGISHFLWVQVLLGSDPPARLSKACEGAPPLHLAVSTGAHPHQRSFAAAAVQLLLQHDAVPNERWVRLGAVGAGGDSNGVGRWEVWS